MRSKNGKNEIIYDDNVETVEAYFKKRVLFINKIKDMLDLGRTLDSEVRVNAIKECCSDRPIKVINQELDISSPLLFFHLRTIMHYTPWLMQKIDSSCGMIYRPYRRFLLLDLGCGGD